MGNGARKKPTKKPKQKPTQPKERLRPMSLYPLDFDTAMSGIIAAATIVSPVPGKTGVRKHQRAIRESEDQQTEEA